MPNIMTIEMFHAWKSQSAHAKIDPDAIWEHSGSAKALRNHHKRVNNTENVQPLYFARLSSA